MTANKSTLRGPKPARPKRSTVRRRSYRVQLVGVPPLVIDDCSTPEEARLRYIRQNGIIDSDHEVVTEEIR